MHMADALLSPAVGAAVWGAAAVAVTYCARRLQTDPDERRVPLMGVLGAFLFAAQMINFSIPGTGSSGHLGGGLLLAILLGPHAALLVMASVLMVQALFFADGGLLALGCNIVNLGFFPAFVGYALYRCLRGPAPGRLRDTGATVIAAIVSLQLGAVAVVLETVASGISALPLGTFLLFMQPIHLAIGIVEGLVTVAVVTYVRTTRPDVCAAGTLRGSATPGTIDPIPGHDPATGEKAPTPIAMAHRRSIRGLVFALLAGAMTLGGVGAWYASKDPDGLEWSLARVLGTTALRSPDTTVHAALEQLQQRMALFPDYGFRTPPVLERRLLAAPAPDGHVPGVPASTASSPLPSPSPDIEAERLGSSVAGIAGGLITLTVTVLFGALLARRARRVDDRA